MKAIEAVLHFFTPRHTNNHRAKALHFSSFSTYIALLLVFQIGLTVITRFNPSVLSYASNITVSDLLQNTNEKRAANGAGQVRLNDQLTAAASAKAADMFADQYWAHVSPTGRDPWSFILAAGYTYLFAGENLARDFGDSRSVVEAWMNSPTHRENLLNDRYRDVGFAVVNGKYANHETTLVVQMFGTRPGSAPTVVTQESGTKSVKVDDVTAPVVSASPGQILNFKIPPSTETKINPFSATKMVSFGVIALLIAVFVVDGILVYKRRIVRLSGHNLAHLLMLLAVLAALNLIGRGVIL